MLIPPMSEVSPDPLPRFGWCEGCCRIALGYLTLASVNHVPWCWSDTCAIAIRAMYGVSC